METLLFRSLESLVDTSALERRAFNLAFAESGLDWHWGGTEFTRLQKIVGERHRIAWYAEHTQGNPISCGKADQILWKKDQALFRLLQHDRVTPRPGVLRLLGEAASAHIQAAVLVSRTKERQILSGAVRQFRAFSSITVEHRQTPVAQPASHLFDCIELHTTPITAVLAQGLVQCCLNVSSSVSGARACITHLGESNNPAMQLSGKNVLHHGSASLRSLLQLESSESASVG